MIVVLTFRRKRCHRNSVTAEIVLIDPVIGNCPVSRQLFACASSDAGRTADGVTILSDPNGRCVPLVRCSPHVPRRRSKQQKIALVKGTIINPANARVEPATVLIENGRITEADPKAVPSAQARLIDCTGKFILPGYIDTHVHFFQSGDLFTRPDAVDLTGSALTRTRSR